VVMITLYLHETVYVMENSGKGLSEIIKYKVLVQSFSTSNY
jgi:hypothetical protein